MKRKMVLQWSLSLIPQCQSLMKSVKWLISGVLFVELLQLLPSKELCLMFCFSYPFSLFPALQGGINGQSAFALISLHCLGRAVLAFWVVAYALHSVLWNLGDHLAKGFSIVLGLITVKIEMPSAPSSIMLGMSRLTVGQAYMRFLCLRVLCAFGFLIYVIIFPKGL